MADSVRDLVGNAAAHAAGWMTQQALLAQEHDAGVVADLRRIGVPDDMLRSGDLLHVALHRLSAELGKSSPIQKWPRPLGLPTALADVAGAGLLLGASVARWWTFILDDAVRGAVARSAAERGPEPPSTSGASAPNVTRLRSKRR